MSFMKLQIFKGDFYLVEGDAGVDMIPADVAGDIGIPVGCEIQDPEQVLVNAVRDFTENRDIHSIQLRAGFYGRYSAPGYTDATDWVYGETEDEVRCALVERYGDE